MDNIIYRKLNDFVEYNNKLYNYIYFRLFIIFLSYLFSFKGVVFIKNLSLVPTEYSRISTAASTSFEFNFVSSAVPFN